MLLHLVLSDQLAQLLALVMRLRFPQEPLRKLALFLVRLLPIARGQLRLERKHFWRMPWLLHRILLA